MPSSNKTLRFSLNKWLGSDKPKKDDFNSDNQKIDDALGALSSSVENIGSVINTSVNSHAQNSALHVTETDKTDWRNASTNTANHIANANVHVTTAQKLEWSKSTDLIVGTYTGTGTASQKITLGYKPKFGLIFAVGSGMVGMNSLSTMIYANSACISELGCSHGASVENDGFTVQFSSTGSPDGFAQRYNTLNVKYVYFVWK